MDNSIIERTDGAARSRPPRTKPDRQDGKPPPDTLRNARRAGSAMLIAFVLMGVFNSSDLRSYARDLPAGWFADAFVRRADQWHALMQDLGPAQVRPFIRSLLDRVRDWQW
jgi:hypothetical protein